MNRNQLRSLKTSGARVYEEYLNHHTAMAIYAEKRADFFRGARNGRIKARADHLQGVNAEFFYGARTARYDIAHNALPERSDLVITDAMRRVSDHIGRGTGSW